MFTVTNPTMHCSLVKHVTCDVEVHTGNSTYIYIARIQFFLFCTHSIYVTSVHLYSVRIEVSPITEQLN
jgi:hypothetical protein